MRALRGVLLALAFAPALGGALLVARHAVDVPVGADWTRAALLEPEAEIPAPSGRAPLPRGAALANARWLGGDLRVEMGLGVAWVALAALCVHGLLRRTFPREPGARLVATFLATALLFSPVQWERFLWATRAWSFLPWAALCAGLWVAGARWPRRAKLPAGLALAALAAATLLPPGGGGGAGADLVSLLRVLGGPFARTTLLPAGALAPVAGAAVLAGFVASAALCLLQGHDPALRRRALPWAGLGGVALAACALVARSLEAPGDALLSRHATPALLVCVACVPLVALAAGHLRHRVPPSRTALRAGLALAPAFAAGVLGVAVALGWGAGLRGMQAWQAARLQARTALVFLERFPPDPHAHLAADLDLDGLRRAARVLQRHGQLRPGPAADGGLGPFARGEPLAPGAGDVGSAFATEGLLHLSGHAWLPWAGRAADGLVVTAGPEGGRRRVVAVAPLAPLLLPPLAEHDHIYNDAEFPGVAERSAWHLHVEAEALPAGPRLRVEVLAADAEALRLHPLPHAVALERSPEGLRTRRVAREGEAR